MVPNGMIRIFFVLVLNIICMKWITIVIMGFIAASCWLDISTKSDNLFKPPCLLDKGIKKAITTAELISDPENKESQIMEYTEEGRPIYRKNPASGDYVKFMYEGKNLKGTIMGNGTMAGDTNFVVSNDVFGRPLKMGGHDGNFVQFVYTGCEKDFQKYTNLDGNLIHTMELTYENNLLVKQVMTSDFEDWSEQITSYYDYKVNEKGHWTERKYQYPSGLEILEKRALTYYE